MIDERGRTWWSYGEAALASAAAGLICYTLGYSHGHYDGRESIAPFRAWQSAKPVEPPQDAGIKTPECHSGNGVVAVTSLVWTPSEDRCVTITVDGVRVHVFPNGYVVAEGPVSMTDVAGSMEYQRAIGELRK